MPTTPTTMFEGQKWRLDFTGWTSLSREQQALLLIVIGDCDGEWWGEGRAEFASVEDALRAVARAAELQIGAPRLTTIS